MTETSDDPQVVLLIRQHAHRAVSEFVAKGWSAQCDLLPCRPGTKRSRRKPCGSAAGLGDRRRGAADGLPRHADDSRVWSD